MSVKTEKAIERDLFRLVKENFARYIKGTVYRKGTRPKDAKTEDIIVAFASGVDGQFQSGELYLNIYIPFIPYGQDSNMIPDIPRIDELENNLIGFYDNCLSKNNEYNFRKRQTPYTTDEESIEQSILTLLLKYNRFTQR